LPTGVALRVGGAAVGARGGGHTWLNETVGGRLPVPMEYIQASTSPSLTAYPETPVDRATQPLPVCDQSDQLGPDIGPKHRSGTVCG
jgi:hypothetical protein